MRNSDAELGAKFIASSLDMITPDGKIRATNLVSAKERRVPEFSAGRNCSSFVPRVLQLASDLSDRCIPKRKLREFLKSTVITREVSEY